MQHHHYSLTELEAMIPWERDVYIAMVSKYVQEENDRIKHEKEQIEANKRRRR